MVLQKEFVKDKGVQLVIDLFLVLCLAILEYLSLGITNLVVGTALLANAAFLMTKDFLSMEGLTEMTKAVTAITLLVTAIYRGYDLLKKRKNK